jgi:hypothetical protein
MEREPIPPATYHPPEPTAPDIISKYLTRDDQKANH